MEFPAAILATILACTAFRWGFHLHHKELRTGKSDGFGMFWLFCVGGSGLLIYFRESSAFLNALFYDTIGIFIGLAVVHFATDFLRPKVQTPDQPKARSAKP